MKGNARVFKLAVCFVSFSLLLSLSFTLSAHGAEKKYLRVGMNADSPPYGFSKGGELVGLEIDLYTEAAKRMGRELVITNLPWAGVFPGLQAGKWDACGNAWVNKERLEMMDFADPWMRATLGFATRQDSKINSLADLKNKIIGAQAGSADQRWLEDHLVQYGPYEIKTYDRVVDQVMDLQHGRIHAFVRDKTRLLYQVKDLPDLHVPFDAGNTFMQAVCFRKGDLLRDEYNKVQNEIKKDGTLAAIYKKWLGVNPEPGHPCVRIFTEPYVPEK